MGSVLTKQVWNRDARTIHDKKPLDIKVESQLPWEGRVKVLLRGIRPIAGWLSGFRAGAAM